jgi:hypothetical protein
MPIVVDFGSNQFIRDWKNNNPNLELWDALHDMATEIRKQAVARAPGRTKQAIDVTSSTPGTRFPTIEVGLTDHPKYAIFVHEGTGIFGPLHKPIFASPGNVFSWESRGRRVFAQFTFGQRPQPFLEEAILWAEFNYIPVRVQMLGVQVSR